MLNQPTRAAVLRRLAALPWCWALGCYMLFAQWMGLTHAVLHAAEPASQAQTQARPYPQPQPQPHRHDGHQEEAGHWLQQLLAGHALDAGACRLFDQASHADIVGVHIPEAPVVSAPCTQPPAAAAFAPRRPPAHARARDPPTVL